MVLKIDFFSFIYRSLVLLPLLLAITAQTAPSPLSHPSAIQAPSIWNSDRKIVDIHKRTRYTTLQLANGWQIRFQLFSVITPIIPAITNLQYLYNHIIYEVSNRLSSGELAGDRIEAVVGQYRLQFAAQTGYGPSIGWEVVMAFVEKMLENRFPMTFICHISPPGSQAPGNGILIRLLAGDQF